MAKPQSPAPFAALDLDDDGDDLAAKLNQFEARAAPREIPTEALVEISEGAGFPSRSPTAAATAKTPQKAVEKFPTALPPQQIEVRGRRKRELTGRSYTFSVKLRPADAQRIYNLVDELNARTVADVIEQALAALEAKARKGTPVNK